MSKMDQFKAQANTALLPILSLALAAGIFTLDTLTVSEVAASVLYVAVVLLAIRFCSPRRCRVCSASMHGTNGPELFPHSYS
jgi:hypothetical protein